MEFAELLGQTLIAIEQEDTIRLVFTTGLGEKYVLHHNQDCCEHVSINDINGDFNDLLYNPLTQAEESTNSEPGKETEGCESFTWTFYKLATVKGYVTIRWLGESNGYYSESVEFDKL